MNKVEIAEKMAEAAGISKAQATKALDTCFESIASAMASGDKVTLIGFGTFSVSERAARTGRNPRTKEEIQIPARKVAKFKAGKTLSDSVQ